MGDIKEVVEYYVARLSSAEREDAWHRLVEAGPAALPHVMAALEATTDVGVQVELVRVLAEYRSADAVPFLADMLSHAQQALWKSALDALVTLGGKAAVEALANARATAPPFRREWIDEAADQTLASLMEAAQAGQARAQLDLGLMCAAGVGMHQDYVQAVTWLRRSAEQGHADAQFHLGDLLGDEDEEGLEWLRKAAVQDHAEAQIALACLYDGVGSVVRRDARQAVAWLRRAAERGHTEAQRRLGGHYARGDGVEQDDERAVRWIRLAAEDGNELAQFELGEMYAAGRGVPRDDVQAAIWRCKAAEHGGDFIQHRLAARYADASPEAREAMDRVMAPALRTQVQQTVRRWREDFENRQKS